MIFEDETYSKIDLLFQNIWSFFADHWQIILTALGFALVQALLHIDRSVSWDLCWYLVTDCLLICTVLFFVAVFSCSVENLWEFYLYERKKLKYQMKNMIKDVYLEVWNDAKYFSYVDTKRIKSIFCTDVYNKNELLKK